MVVTCFCVKISSTLSAASRDCLLTALLAPGDKNMLEQPGQRLLAVQLQRPSCRHPLPALARLLTQHPRLLLCATRRRSIARDIGSANVPGYSQYLAFINDLRDIWIGATGEHASWQARQSMVRCPCCVRHPAPPPVALHAVGWGLGCVRQPVQSVHATEAQAAGRWGIVQTSLGMRRPNWSQVGPGGIKAGRLGFTGSYTCMYLHTAYALHVFSSDTFL